MTNPWKEMRGLTASRTGLPSTGDYEQPEPDAARRGSWIAVLAIAVAFAAYLQMEFENRQSDLQDNWIVVSVR